MHTKIVIKSFLLLYSINSAICDDIFGCGGFVKSSFKINYSRVEIKLYTKHGSLKYQTDCAPVNGYYLIPLYDKGDYTLRIEPPNGWSFEPSSVSLHVDGSTDPCSLNQDINFHFKGFTASGQVKSDYAKKGSAGVKLILRNSKKEVVNETFSEENGLYSFPHLTPDRYIVEASHPIWIFENSVQDLNVVDDNLVHLDKIKIAGYDVRGAVLSDGQPIQGVHFLLFSSLPSHITSFLGCDASEVKGFSHAVSELFPYACHVTSSKDGQFVFPALPPNFYRIVPFYKGEHIKFDVSPPHLDFTLEEGSLHIQESFQIQGFSVSGWIGTKPKSQGLSGVGVYIDNHVRDVTDENGVYHLENMRAGLYQLYFKKHLYGFPTVEMKISPNTPRLPDVLVERFSVCGQLGIDEYPTGLERSDRKIILKSLKDNQQTLLSVQPNGSFCSEIVPGQYEIEAIVSETESSLGLKFIPEKIQFTIVDEPLLNLEFRQFRAEVKGKVKCIGSCEGVILELAPVSYDRPHLKAEASAVGEFEFEKCLPGNYILTVVKEDWCFQSKTLKVAITDKDVLNLQLHQTGFQVAVTLTHASAFKVKYPSGAVHDVDLGVSRNVLCLPESGSYDFLPVGCHLYQKDVYRFDTHIPTELSLTPVKHLVTGSVLTETNVTDLKVLVVRGGSVGEELISLQEPLERRGEMYRYTFSVFAQPHSQLEIKVSSKQLLFRPSESVVLVANDCLEEAVELIGRQGLFLNGSVLPPISGVAIQLFKGENLYSETTTDDQGLFWVGPLEEGLSSYKVVAESEGYVFTPTSKVGHFRAFKLAEVQVLVQKESGELLQGVLVSLTGGPDYRKNSVTQSDGRVSFMGLGPGKYYLRSMLKEYSFDPASQTIDIEEGKLVSITIKGVRVAYSVKGVVTSLTGEAEVGVALEALNADGHVVEEALSEEGGVFRIRGLHPGHPHKLRIKPQQSHIERSSPKEINVQVSDGDMTGVRIIVFRHYGQMDISGNIITSQEFLQTLKVRLYREDVSDQLVYSVTPGSSSFFFLPSLPMDGRPYVLRLESSLSSTSYHVTLPSMSFTANTTFRHFSLPIAAPKPRSTDHEVAQGSVLALPIAIVIVLFAYNFSKMSSPAAAVATASVSAKKTRQKKILLNL